MKNKSTSESVTENLNKGKMFHEYAVVDAAEKFQECRSVGRRMSLIAAILNYGPPHEFRPAHNDYECKVVIERTRTTYTVRYRETDDRVYLSVED